MNLDDLTIGDARKLAAMFSASTAQAPAPSTSIDHGLCILAADRGWVFVGHVTESDDRFTLTNSRTVIRWGTTKGLDELAEKGPLQNTNLGAVSTRRIVPLEAVKFVVACNADAWGA